MGEKRGMAEWRKVEDNLYHAPLPSTEELFRRVDATRRTEGADSASTRGDDRGWYGGMSYDDAVEAATKGWLEGAKLVREAARKVHQVICRDGSGNAQLVHD